MMRSYDYEPDDMDDYEYLQDLYGGVNDCE